MLSYRHACHAGNHADVLKHLTQMLILQSLRRKEKPFLYLDTHAGAGRYDLQTALAEKTREYEQGIARVLAAADKQLPAPLRDYVQLITAMNPAAELRYYPGSPWLAEGLLRGQDRARLYELHPADQRLLAATMAQSDKRVQLCKADGFHALKADLPPLEKRGLILIDPPYEIKTDYTTVVKAVQAGYQRFATGIYAIWYPVVQRATVDDLEQAFQASGIRAILQCELNVRADSTEYGMTGSGMLVINPPWQLADQLGAALPWLVDCLAQDSAANGRVRMLVGEA